MWMVVQLALGLFLEAKRHHHQIGMICEHLPGHTGISINNRKLGHDGLVLFGQIAVEQKLIW